MLFSSALKSTLIGFLLFCSMSAALFGSSCGSTIAGVSTPTFRAQTCAMTFFTAPALPADTGSHVAVMTVPAVAVVSTILAVLVLAQILPRYIRRPAFLVRRKRWRWIWSKIFSYNTDNLAFIYYTAFNVDA